MALSLKLPIKIFFFNTVHNLITFSIVFTNKNRGGGTFRLVIAVHPKKRQTTRWNFMALITFLLLIPLQNYIYMIEITTFFVEKRCPPYIIKNRKMYDKKKKKKKKIFNFYERKKMFSFISGICIKT